MTAEHRLGIAVAIATFNRERVLVETLQQVLAQQPGADEVIVIDQTLVHEPATDAYLSEMSGRGAMRVVRQSAPSLCAARNAAVLHSSSDVILYLDDDILMPADVIGRHLAVHADPTVAAVVQDISESNEQVRARVEATVPQQGAGLKDVNYLRGYNFSVKRKPFIEVGGFDEGFVGSVYRDESDFAERLRARGFRIVADKAVNVVHLRAPSGGCRIPGNRAHPEWTKSLGFFIYGFRHGGLMQELITSARAGPLRKENVLRPWRWPMAWGSYFYSMIQGRQRARAGVRSPFVTAMAR